MTKFFAVASFATVLSLFAGWASAAESTEVVCHESEPQMVCYDRPLEQDGRVGETVRVCETVRQIVCTTVEVEAAR